jgi:uncharacterized BrkB/YihY/UPF0761 family membrane protein
VTKPSGAKDVEQKRFQIQQLRIDKIVFSVEALLVAFLSFLLLVGFPMIYAYIPNLPPYSGLVILGIGVGTSLLALLGNLGRFMTIRRLEKELMES